MYVSQDFVHQMKTIIERSRTKSLALAALYIVQSMLLEFEEPGEITHEKIQGLLKDAAKTLRGEYGNDHEEDWLAASEIVEALRLHHERLKL